MNANEMRTASEGRRARWLPLVWATCVLGLAVPVSANAQESGGPQGQGRNSQGEEDQRSLVTQPVTGAAMPGSQKLEDAADRPLPGRPLTRMEQLIKTPPPVRRGQLPPLSQVTTAQPTLGGGQTHAVRPPRPAKSFLKIVLRVKSDGSSEVLSATEMAGEPPVSEEPLGDYVYEVADGDETLAAEALSDPFAAHSFGGPEDEKEGHHEIRSTEATIVVTVPGRSLTSPLDKLSVRLYKVKPGVVLERVNSATVRKLKADNRLDAVVTSPAAKLAPEIRRRGVRLQE